MKQNLYVNFAFFLIILIFPFIRNSLIQKPYVYKLDLKSDIKKKYSIEKINYDNEFNNYLKHKISIGDTYIINSSSNKEIRVTPISTWSFDDLDFEQLSIELPDLIIQSNEIKKINQNNYAVGIINDENYAQTCLFDSKTFLFKNLRLDIPKFSDINYWNEVMLSSLRNNFFNFTKSENCLLITSSEINNFEVTIEIIYKLINID